MENADRQVGHCIGANAIDWTKIFGPVTSTEDISLIYRPLLLIAIRVLTSSL